MNALKHHQQSHNNRTVKAEDEELLCFVANTSCLDEQKSVETPYPQRYRVRHSNSNFHETPPQQSGAGNPFWDFPLYCFLLAFKITAPVFAKPHFGTHFPLFESYL
jgi:hypothetical protein